MRLFLRISKLNIVINNFPFEEVPKQLRPFVFSFKEQDADIVCEVESYVDAPKLSGECIVDLPKRKFYKDDNIYSFMYTYPNGEETVNYYTVADCSESKIRILLPQKYEKRYLTTKIFMSLLVFDFVILNFSRMMMHASVVSCENGAILFTGPSGIGKSTQANLWKNEMNAKILNGDRAILHIQKESVWVHGSPYAGSSGIYRNECTNVKAIVLLEQGKENVVKRLAVRDAYKLLYPRFSMAIWDKEMLVKGIKMLEKILEMVPVYVFSCLPEKSAVEVLNKLLEEN